MNATRFLTFVLMFGLVVLCGCGGAQRSRVHGTVKYKGTPVKAGMITFTLEGAQSPAGGAPIVDGAYEIAAKPGLPPGKYKVSISASDSKAAKEEMPGVSTESKELIPAKYNAKTELVREVEAGKTAEFDFDLKQ